ncbi:hypothetical protein BaRGS_00028540, partial [Batillaria attramentaria]
TDEELDDFLREILPEFLRVVDARQSGLIDTLYANEVITDSDNSSLSGKDVLTRKDQARKLFIILNKIPVDVFRVKVAPELCVKFPHIIPDRFKLKTGAGDTTRQPAVAKEECLHHAIQNRIRPATMADMLYHQGCLSLDEYRLGHGCNRNISRTNLKGITNLTTFRCPVTSPTGAA